MESVFPGGETQTKQQEINYSQVRKPSIVENNHKALDYDYVQTQ